MVFTIHHPHDYTASHTPHVSHIKSPAKNAHLLSLLTSSKVPETRLKMFYCFNTGIPLGNQIQDFFDDFNVVLISSIILYLLSSSSET